MWGWLRFTTERRPEPDIWSHGPLYILEEPSGGKCYFLVARSMGMRFKVPVTVMED